MSIQLLLYFQPSFEVPTDLVACAGLAGPKDMPILSWPSPRASGDRDESTTLADIPLLEISGNDIMFVIKT